MGPHCSSIARRRRPQVRNNETEGDLLRYIYLYAVFTQNSPCGIVTYRTDNKPDVYLPERSVGRVWGGGKGEGNVPSVRASTQPDTTLRFSLDLNPVCAPSIY